MSWKIPADFVRTVLKGHSLLGLALATAIYLVCLTGTVAVFMHELQRWENATVPAAPQIEPQAVQKALESVIARTDGEVEHLYITMPGGDLPWLHISGDAHAGSGSWAANIDGDLVESAASPWTDFLTRLHIDLHLPHTWGVFIVGLTGVALLSSLISGLLAHPRIFRDAFHLRIGGSPRLQEADIHNRLGVWGLPFHFTVSLTGALLGLATLIIGVLGLAMFQGDVSRVYALLLPPQPADDPRPAGVIDLRPMFAQLPTLSPGGRVERVLLEHPTEMGGAALFYVHENPRRIAGSASFTFDRSGKPVHVAHVADNNLGQSILGSLGLLHFGWFGGGLVKIAYGLLGLAVTYLAAGGVIIWLHRRRAKGNPAPGWERIWTAVIWGQPLALAASLAAVVLIGRAGAIELSDTLPLIVWGLVTVVSLACAPWLAAPRMSLGFGLGTAALLAIAAVAHAAFVGTRMADSIGWVVDGVLLTIAVVLLISVWLKDLSLPRSDT
ncbi:MAG: PepSY-associated TM helix domain-containing protein [Steroidobacteraceae bacterium]